jgi:hypothetical protein
MYVRKAKEKLRLITQPNGKYIKQKVYLKRTKKIETSCLFFLLV